MTHCVIIILTQRVITNTSAARRQGELIMATKTKTDVVVEKASAMTEQAALEATSAAKNGTSQAKSTTLKITRIRLPKPVRQAYLASLGAVSLAQDESGAFFNKLVKQGVEAEKEGRQWLRHANKRTQDRATKATGRVEESVEAATDRVEQTVDRVLAKLNVPSKSDIERLSTKITDLSLKVDELTDANAH